MDFKPELLEIAETLSVDAVNGVFTLIEGFIKDDGNPYDDMLLPFIGQAKGYVLNFVDKIDGAQG